MPSHPVRNGPEHGYRATPWGSRHTRHTVTRGLTGLRKPGRRLCPHRICYATFDIAVVPRCAFTSGWWLVIPRAAHPRVKDQQSCIALFLVVRGPVAMLVV